MRSVTALAALAVTLPTAALAASWTLTDYYNPDSFTTDDWIYYTETDPTDGLVTYESQASAESLGLIGKDANGDFVMRVDNQTERLSGRPSVRLTSAASYGDGVYIINATHFPTGCAVWPAFWTVTADIDNWPIGGEIDIMEMVNDQYTSNLASLHTNDTCTLPTDTEEYGTVVYTGCSTDTGCRVEMNGTTGASAANTGTAFNAAGGGIYAMERSLSSTGKGIRVWYFPPGSEPSDISSNSTTVNPDNWGEAGAVFPVTSCADQFSTHNLVFTMTLCGTWAGTTYDEVATCVSQYGSCSSQVAYNGSSFDEAYWSVNYVKVFATGGGSDNANVTGTTTQAATATASSKSSSSTSGKGSSSNNSTSGASGLVPDAAKWFAATALTTSLTSVAFWLLLA